jgi:hypothetical protein
VNRTYISKLQTAASYRGLEIIVKLATVVECEPSELLRVAGYTVSYPTKTTSSRNNHATLFAVVCNGSSRVNPQPPQRVSPGFFRIIGQCRQ